MTFYADAPEGEPLGSRTLAGKAAKVRGAVGRTAMLVESLRMHLAGREVAEKIENMYVPPTWQEVFAGALIKENGGWFVQSVEFFKAIISKYDAGEFDPHEIERDILQISAQIISFSSWVNHIDACATEAKANREQAERMILVEARAWMNAEGIQSRAVNSDLVRGLVAEHTEKLRRLESTMSVVAATVKGFYYSLRDFLNYLDRVSQRAQHERFEARRS